MKNITGLILLIITLFAAASCKKTGNAGSNIIYEETVPGIKKHEPVLLSFSNGNTSDKVSWSVTPGTGVKVSTVGNTATITFTNPGSYIVLAAAGNVTARYTVIVENIEYNEYGTAYNLSASKFIKINQTEPVTFTVRNAARGSKISWSVYSKAYEITIDSSNNSATVIFTGGGIGSVTTSDGINTQRRTVRVNDSTNINTELDTVPFILGDKIHLTPSIKTTGGTKELVILAATQNNYHCATDKILSFSVDNEYMIDYSGVAVSKEPCTQPGSATTKSAFTNIPAGTHKFTINVENKTYSGMLTVSNAGVYTFDWPENTAVSISPLVVQ